MSTKIANMVLSSRPDIATSRGICACSPWRFSSPVSSSVTASRRASSDASARSSMLRSRARRSTLLTSTAASDTIIHSAGWPGSQLVTTRSTPPSPTSDTATKAAQFMIVGPSAVSTIVTYTNPIAFWSISTW